MNRHRLTTQQGVGLMEILVSLLVLSVGILGMIGLLLTSMQVSNQSHFQTEAMHHLNSIGDRIRANPDAAGNGDFTLALTSTPVALTRDCSTLPCDASQLALFDLEQWRNNVVNGALPDSGVRITADNNATPSIYTITMMWDPTRSGVTGTGCSTDTDDKNCLTLTIRL